MADEGETTSEVKNELSSEIKKQSPVKKKFYQKTWGKILIIVAIVFIGLIIIVFQATSGAVKASNKFLDALQAGDSDTAYSLFSKEAKDNVDEDDFSDAVDQVGSVLNTKEKITDRSIEAETGKSSTAKVVYEIVGTDSKTYVVQVDLIKEDGAWKVENFDSDEK